MPAAQVDGGRTFQQSLGHTPEAHNGAKQTMHQARANRTQHGAKWLSCAYCCRQHSLAMPPPMLTGSEAPGHKATKDDHGHKEACLHRQHRRAAGKAAAGQHRWSRLLLQQSVPVAPGRLHRRIFQMAGGSRVRVTLLLSLAPLTCAPPHATQNCQECTRGSRCSGAPPAQTLQRSAGRSCEAGCCSMERQRSQVVRGCSRCGSLRQGL